MKNTWVLVRRYFSQEVRNSNVLFSLGLYLVGVAYLIYLLNGGGVPADKTWNSLLWIVVFFGAIQLSARSFEYESNDYFYYYQTIAGPAETIIAKLLFNSAYIAVISGLTWGLFSLFFGNPVFNTLLFGLALLLGSVGCSCSAYFNFRCCATYARQCDVKCHFSPSPTPSYSPINQRFKSTSHRRSPYR